jgi:anti-sigma factor RsiW
MVIRCQDVWQELSNYIDNEVDAPRRASMDEHFAACRHCTSLLAGTRNIVQLYGDRRLIAPPAGYNQRVLRRVLDRIEGQRGGIYGWMMALAAAGAMAGFLFASELSRFAVPPLRSAHSQPTAKAPAGVVAVVAGGKTYHVAGCPFLHGKVQMLPTAVAIQQGYSPCIHCMRGALEH